MAAISPRQIILIAHSQGGVTEKPFGSNKVRYNTAYYGRAVSGAGFSWCGTFVWWVFREAGIDLRQQGIRNPASTNAFDDDAARMGWRRIDKHHAQVGDIILYDFGDLDGPGPDTANDNDHIGICSRNASGSSLKAWEGNTSPGSGGSQANGGGVFERTRSLSLVRHVYRPPYEKWSLAMASGSLKPQSEEDEMPTADEIAKAVWEHQIGLSDKAAAVLNQKDGKAPASFLLTWDGATSARTLSAVRDFAAKSGAREAVLLDLVKQITHGGQGVDFHQLEAAAKAGADAALAELGERLTDQ